MEETSETLHNYAVTPGQVDASGIEYEINMATLLYLRATKMKYKFLLATGVKAAGKFDDIVLEYDDGTNIKTILMQLKHKQRKATKYTDLLSINKSNSNFSLIKYYKSYCEIRNSFMEKTGIKWRGKFEDFMFVLCTNAQLNSKRIVCAQNEDPNTDLLMAGGKIVSLTHSDILKKELNEKFAETEDLKYMNEFMNQVVLIVGQANQKELNFILKQEIQEIYRLSEYGADTALKYLKDQIHLWWENNNTIKTSIKENIFSIKTANEIAKVVSKYESQLGNIDIDFREEVVTQMKDLFNSSEEIIIIKAKNISTKSACFKLSHALRKLTEIPLCVTTEMLQDCDCINNILNIWPSQWCKLLMVEKHNSADIHDTMNSFRKLTEFIKNQQECKIIIVSSDLLLEQFKLQKLECTIRAKEITVNLNEITETSKLKLLNKEVCFQGYPVILNDLLQNVNSEVCSELISDLFTGENIQIGKPIVPVENYFVKRCLLQKCYVQSSILVSGPTDIIALSGPDKSKLEEFLGEHNQRMNISNQITRKLIEKMGHYKKFQERCSSLFSKRSSNAKHYSPVHVINTLDDFTILCKGKVNVHWLELKHETFKWKQTYGDITAIQNNCEDEHCSYEVTSVWDVPDQIVIVTAACGMGKSTLMKSVGYHTKIISPNKLVIEINLNDCTHFLASLEGKEITKSDVNKFLLLADIAENKNSYQNNILCNFLNLPEKCILLIDSFDEVMPRYESTIMPLLIRICEINFEKVWITSRITYAHKLEQLLQIISFSIKPLVEYEQNQFFIKYWETKQLNSDPDIISNFAKYLLQMHDSKTFFGIPLYCKMVAEVYKDLVSNDTATNKFPKLNIANLCEKFVEQTFNAYCMKYNIDTHETKAELSEMVKERKKRFHENHMTAALSVFFTQKQLNKIKKFKNIPENLQNFQLEEKTGFINSIRNGRPQFTHTIFIEYFVAKFLTENLNLAQDLIKYLYRNKFSAITNFIDHMVLDAEPLHAAVIASDLERITQLLHSPESTVNKTDIFGRTPLHLAICYHHVLSADFTCEVKIVEELLQHGAKVNIIANVIKVTPFYYACISCCRWRILAAIYEYGDITKSNIKILKKIIKKETDFRQLYLVFRDGYKQFYEFFIQNAKYVESLKCGLALKAAFEGDLNVLKYLLHHKLLKYDENDKNEIIYTAKKKGHTHIVEYLTSEHHLNQYALLSGQFSRRSRVEHVFISERVQRIKQYQKAKNTDMNLVINNCGEDILFIVDSIDCVKYLVDICKLSPRIPDHYGRLPIHVASGNNFPDIVQYYLETCNIDCNVTDNNGNAPLHHACMSAWDGNISVVKLLVDSYKVNTNLKNNAGATPFLIASSQPGSLETLKYILEHGSADVFATDSFGNTALHCSAYYGDIDIVKYLVECCKINPLIKNNTGKTALELLNLKADSNILLSKDAIKYLEERENSLK